MVVALAEPFERLLGSIAEETIQLGIFGRNDVAHAALRRLIRESLIGCCTLRFNVDGTLAASAKCAMRLATSSPQRRMLRLASRRGDRAFLLERARKAFQRGRGIERWCHHR